MTPSFSPTPGSGPQEAPRRPSPWRRVLLGALLLGLVAAGAVFIWSARHYQGLVTLGKDAQTQYSTVNQQYHFTPPAPAAAPAATTPADGLAPRLEAMLRVRQSALAALTPGLERKLEKTLDAPCLSSAAQLRALLTGTPQLRAVMDAHLAALNREQMSLAEYQWLLGLAISNALDDPERHPAGQGYAALLRDFARLSQGTGHSLDPPQVLRGLHEMYAQAPQPAPGVLETLDRAGRIALLLDWAALGAQWAFPDADHADSPLPGLLPGDRR